MKGLMPSPTCSMSRLLAKNFDLVIVPEFNTSKTCSKCHSTIDMISPGKVNNPKPWKREQLIEIRGLRRCQNDFCKTLWSEIIMLLSTFDNFADHIIHRKWLPLFAKPRPKTTLKESSKGSN